MLAIGCWAWGLLLNVVCFPMTLHWRKLIFIFAWLSIGEGLWPRGGANAYFSSQCWDTIWLRPKQAPVYSARVCEFLRALVLLFFWRPCFLDVLHPQWLFPPSLPRGSLSCEQRDSMETSHVGLSIPRSPALLCPDFPPGAKLQPLSLHGRHLLFF